MTAEDAPQLPGHTIRTVAAVLAAAVAVAGAAWWWQTSHWPVNVVRIDGTVAHTDRGHLKTIVTRHAQAGFFAMDLGALRSDLVALPWVRDASLRRIWPDTLAVVVHEHTPAVRWNGDSLISRGGTVYTPGDAALEGLPRLTGPEGHGPAMLERMRTFAAALGPLGLGIVGLHEDARRAWRIELDNGVTVRLGRDSVDARLRRFVRVWPAVLAPRADDIAAVDLRYTNGFAVAWRDGEPKIPRQGGA